MLGGRTLEKKLRITAQTVHQKWKWEIKSLKSKQNAENNHGHKLTNLNPHPLTQHQNIAKYEWQLIPQKYMIYKSTTNWQNQYTAKQNVIITQKQQKLLFIVHIPRKCKGYQQVKTKKFQEKNPKSDQSKWPNHKSEVPKSSPPPKLTCRFVINMTNSLIDVNRWVSFSALGTFNTVSSSMRMTNNCFCKIPEPVLVLLQNVANTTMKNGVLVICVWS